MSLGLVLTVLEEVNKRDDDDDDDDVSTSCECRVFCPVADSYNTGRLRLRRV